MRPLRTLTTMAVMITLALPGCATGDSVSNGASGDSASSGASGDSASNGATARPSVTPTTAGAPGEAPSAVTGTPATATTARAGVESSKPRAETPPRRAGKTRHQYAFPVDAANVAFHPEHSGYPATDIFADCGTPVVAVTTGRVLEVSRRDGYVPGRPDGPLNGGLSVSLLGDDGVRYYGSHLLEVQPGIMAGVSVRAGQRLGRLGRTGNANNVCHLHFGISAPCARVGDWKIRRGAIWPAPYLRSWRDGGARSPVSEVTAWERAGGCRA